MPRDDLRELLTASPFRPFRVRMSRGPARVIQHPEGGIVRRTTLVVRRPDVAADVYLEEHLSLVHIVRLEVLA